MKSRLPANNDCEFCDEFAQGSSNSFSLHYGDQIANRTILERDGFRVLPSLGQIVPGYLLLVPNHHYRAFADMSRKELEGAEAMKAHLTNKMRAHYGNLLFFEHGVRTIDSGGCGISHAHMHSVPFSEAADPVDELKNAFPSEEIASLPDLALIRPNQSYLYYEAIDGHRYVFYPRYIQSQYIRRLLANALGIKEWDWRRCGKEETLLSTLTQVSQTLSAVPR